MVKQNFSSNVLIVLDSYKYVTKENVIRSELEQFCNPSFYYTDYENKLIRFFHGIKGIGNFLSHIAYWTASLFSAIKIFHRMEDHGSKIFINPLVGIFYCFLLALLKKNDDVCIAGFLFVEKQNKLYLSWREKFVNFSYARANKIIVYSSNEVGHYSQRFPLLASKFKFIKYGRDYDIFKENEYLSNEKYVASGGSSNRDFNTLACALDHLEKKKVAVKCKIATRPGADILQCSPSNLEILYDIRLDKFGSFLDKSLFVVIPVKNSGVSGGHMALLEAMSRGKLIIVTDIPGVRDYVDEENVIFYKPEDSIDLAGKIEYVLTNLNDEFLLEKAENAKKLYFEKYHFCALVNRLVKEMVA